MVVQEDEALFWIEQQRDPPWIEERYIDDEIGELYHVKTKLDIQCAAKKHPSTKSFISSNLHNVFT